MRRFPFAAQGRYLLIQKWRSKKLLLLMLILLMGLPINGQREESKEMLDVPDEDPIERLLEEPLVKRRPTWCRKILQEVEGHATPKGTFKESKRPQRFSGLFALVEPVFLEPSSFEEETKHQVWKDAMLEEYKSILMNDVWEVVPRPQGKSVATSKWIYKVKYSVYGSVEKCKARFVSRGFSQKEGIDYDKTFAPVARYNSIRVIISLTLVLGWKLHQMDVKIAFLNGKIEEEVYIEQPEGFELHGKDTHVYKLKKALYGLKKAPRAWYAKIDSYLHSLGFSKSIVDSNLYIKVVKNQPFILVLYVDDLLFTREEHLIAQCKRELTTEFEMKDLGLLHYFLGLEVT